MKGKIKMGIIEDLFTRQQEIGAAGLGINPLGTSAETITTTKKEYNVRLKSETKGGFQQAIGEGMGDGLEAWGEGIGYGYGQIATGVGMNIIPIGLLLLGSALIVKKL